MDLHVDGIAANLAEPAAAQKQMSSSFRQIDTADVMHRRHGRSKRLIASNKNSGNFSSIVDGAIFGANAMDFATDRV
ncbi:MAG: hypothetical protein AB7O50_01440 [Pseudolabrys sp.]